MWTQVQSSHETREVVQRVVQSTRLSAAPRFGEGRCQMKNGVYLRGRVWWIQYCVAGKVVRESSGSTRKEDAKALLDAKRTAGRQGQFIAGAGRVVLADLFTVLAADAKAKHRDRPKVRNLCDYFDVAVTKGDDGSVTYSGGRKASAVNYAVLQAYVASRQDADASDSTIHNELAALRRAYRLARKAGKVATVPDFPMPKVENVRESFFTVAQLDRLLTFLPRYLVAPVRFAALTGIRRENVFGLTWDLVDFGRGELRLPFGRTKTGEPVKVPFEHQSEIEELLRLQERAKHGAYVFHRNGERIKNHYGAWETAVRKLGPDAFGTQFDPKTGTSVKVLKRFHDLRHTFAQMMTDAGVPESEILSVGGWKTRAMLDRYRISSEDAKRRALQQRDVHLKAEREKAEKVLDFPQKAAG